MWPVLFGVQIPMRSKVTASGADRLRSKADRGSRPPHERDIIRDSGLAWPEFRVWWEPCFAGAAVADGPTGERELIFWCCLIEKAFAKMVGSYAGIQGGLTNIALHHMTGGLVSSLIHTSGSAESVDALWDTAFRA